ncbi:hypothetical protein BDZ85DRAFT_83678 [Elsinoe ampelina]|uniref:Molybdopterin synthase sulfur carrier subunit n=1 Tax=Elsinoe ampelina TaxID=302913 RepID=A0A6A6GGB1_9PEZI|nr:hypothetical protein BDZ85DRAFT_83678 [Elsinoe ampelina]
MSTSTLLLFASAQTYTNKTTLLLPAPLTVPELYAHLESLYPGITAKVLSSAALTVNLEYVDVHNDKDFVIKAGDEVAVIPPVSSG